MLAIDSFRLNQIRFALTALGMVIGTASLILVVTIGLSGRRYVLTSIQNIGTNLIWAEYAGLSDASIASLRDYLTVSYTHLDVYKRQGTCCSIARISSTVR